MMRLASGSEVSDVITIHDLGVARAWPGPTCILPPGGSKTPLPDTNLITVPTFACRARGFPETCKGCVSAYSNEIYVLLLDEPDSGPLGGGQHAQAAISR